MKTHTSLLLAALCGALLCFAPGRVAQAAANGSPPTQLTYQGFLTDANGVPLGATAPTNKAVIFRIYDAQSGGTLKWSSQQIVTVDKGHFSVLLGEGSQFGTEPFNADLTGVFIGTGASDRYLELTVDGGTIAPRLRFLPAPYAMLAKSAGQLVDPLTGNNALSIASGNLTASGSLNATSLSGNGANLTTLNASQITSGTLNNARTTATSGNTANAIVARDASGNFNAGTITATSFSGGGAGLTSLSGANISAGSIANAAISASAAIADSKLATITTAGKVANTATTATANKVADTIMQRDGVNRVYAGTFRAEGAGEGLVHDNGSGVVLASRMVGSEAAFGTTTVNPLNFITGNGVKMTLTSGGYLGIGTTLPVVPLDVRGFVNRSGLNYFHLDSAGTGQRVNQIQNVSIKSEWAVEADKFLAVSDQRIKEAVGQADTLRDLQTVQKLRVTDYRMKDRAALGGALQKGFIAQEVQAEIPEAVHQSRAFIPDIYAVADGLKFDTTAQTLRLSLSKAHGLKPGDRVRLITDDASSEHAVAAVANDRTFVVSSVTAEPKRVFVYGKQVDDFLSVDYNRVFTTGISAIQELAKQVEALRKSESRVSELEREVSELRKLSGEVAELKRLIARIAEVRPDGRPAVAAPASEVKVEANR